MLDKDGKLPRVGRALMADAIGTVAGACLGTSTVTTFVESSAGISEGGVEQAVATAVAMNANGDNGIPVPYYTEDVSTKVVKIIQSYTGVVNKMVWRKN